MSGIVKVRPALGGGIERLCKCGEWFIVGTAERQRKVRNCPDCRAEPADGVPDLVELFGAPLEDPRRRDFLQEW